MIFSPVNITLCKIHWLINNSLGCRLVRNSFVILISIYYTWVFMIPQLIIWLSTISFCSILRLLLGPSHCTHQIQNPHSEATLRPHSTTLHWSLCCSAVLDLLVPHTRTAIAQPWYDTSVVPYLWNVSFPHTCPQLLALTPPSSKPISSLITSCIWSVSERLISSEALSNA